ncbi:MAG: M14 family zinc carboxypeptidase [Thermoanaerobaculia bacterium]
MRRSVFSLLLLATTSFAPALLAQPAATRVPTGFEPDLSQPIDADATARIKRYTTAPEFNSPLTDYLPSSTTVPAPQSVLGDVAGAPGILPYVADVHRYFRALAAASPRVEVISIGTSEEGRERIAVLISSEANIEKVEENRTRLAQLADPRSIGLDDARAAKIIAASVPVYYITGAIHSPETGSPTALMELAYRLAVDESPYIRNIRENLVTMITPVVEVDGRDRMVDIYRWHLAHPKSDIPNLTYWGHYVAHDNNRDGMGLTLSLSRNVLDNYVAWHAQVLHDLHESVPFLYDNTVGDGPYNAWVDPLLTNEWQLFGWSNVAELTKFGMPGVFTHGDFDTWSPGYLMFMAAMHNGISRLYETFGNGGADTEVRELGPDEYSRTWYRQDPPWPRVEWSQRNNNNYMQSGLLVSLAFAAENRNQLLTNFWAKSKRSIQKPEREGPSAWVLPADDPRPEAQAELLRVLALQHVEVSRLAQPFTVKLSPPPADTANGKSAEGEAGASAAVDPARKSPPTERLLPAGSYVVRMDQPYCRIADALLDHQYWSPDDPQRHPYDDTGWSFAELFDVEALRIVDAKVLDAPMERLSDPVHLPGGVSGTGPVFLVANHGADALVALRYAIDRDAASGTATVEAATELFHAQGRDFPSGSWIVTGVDRELLQRDAARLGLSVVAADRPEVGTRPVGRPRIALLHSWIDTQTEGWWRQRLDLLGIPYDYISTQDVAARDDLGASYDVVLFPPVGVRNPQAIVTGMPMWGDPMPWKVTPETPNLGTTDETDDQRPGLGFAGLEHLQRFVEGGGLLVAVEDTASLMIRNGLTTGVRVADAGALKVVGTILDARFPEPASPVAAGYGERLSVYSANGMSFELSRLASGGFQSDDEPGRPTGRGGAHDIDTPQGRHYPAAPAPPKAERWESLPLTGEQRRQNPDVIPENLLPHTLVRFGDAGDLLVSGLLDHGGELARRAAVVDSPRGKGHILLFAINPIWRGSTIGSHPLVWNAILAFDHLGIPAKVAGPASPVAPTSPATPIPPTPPTPSTTSR